MRESTASRRDDPRGHPTGGGEDWRLLGAQDGAGASSRTGVATTPEQLESLWAESGLPGEIPAVDFESEIAIWFGAVYGSSCSIRLDGVVVADGKVHGHFVLPGSAGACTTTPTPTRMSWRWTAQRCPRAPSRCS